MSPKKTGTQNSSMLRKKAMDMLRKRELKDAVVEDLSRDDLMHLIHELEVHQVELEIQNDELLLIQSELEVSRFKFIDLYDFAPIGYFTLDKKGLIQEVNLTGADLLGMERSSLINKPFSRFVNREDQDILYLHNLKVFEGIQKTCELKLKRENGSDFYAELESIAAKDNTGSFNQCRTAVSDITKRKMVEKALLESEAEMRTLLANSPDFIINIDHDGEILFINHNLPGHSIEDTIGKKIYDYLRPTDTDIHKKAIEQVFQKGQKTIIESVVAGSKSLASLYETRIVPVNGNDGEIDSVLLIAKDITEKRQAEIALQESENKYRSLYSTMSEGVVLNEIIYDDAGNAVDYQALDANPAYESILDITLDKAIGCKASELYGSGEAPYLDIYEKVAASGEPFEFETYFPPMKKHFRIACFSPQKGKFANVFSDISERKKTEEELNKYRELLEKMVKKRTIELQMTYDQLLHAEKLSAIGNMSASIAHEFNNPLYGIQNVLKGIKKRVPLENEDADLLHLALKECTRIKELIQDLQDFNRPSNSVVAPIDVHKTIDNMLMLLTLELKSKKIAVEKNYATNMPAIRAVGDQIKQVLLNMFNNAVYALSDNKGVITISTEILDKQRVAIHIRDSGKGIDPEDMDHIFEPFFTTKDETDGTGLGLSVSFGIIKRHGGKITANSKVGKGTTFTIILPIDGLPT